MKSICFAVLLLSTSVSFGSTSNCFDPRAVFIQCAEGTEFTGWDKGTCPGNLVMGPICTPKCFDPRVALVQCDADKTFKGWDKGDCTGDLVKAAICE